MNENNFEAQAPAELEPGSLKGYFSRIGLACLLLRVVTVGLQYIFAFAFRGTAFYDHWSFNWFLSMAPLYFAALPIFWFVLPRPCAPLGERRKLGGVSLLTVCLFSISCMMILNYVGFGVTLAINKLSGGVLGNTDGLTNLVSTSPTWATVVFACVAAPIMEELIFRKLLIDRVKPFGEFHSCLLSGLIFGLFHGNFRQFFYAAALGFVFAYVYLKTRNILYTICLHMGINLLGSVVTPTLLSQKNLEVIDALAFKLENDPTLVTSDELMTFMLVLGTLAVGGALVIGGVVMFFVRLRKIKLEKGELTVTGGVGRLIYTDPAMIAAMIFMGASFILALL